MSKGRLRSEGKKKKKQVSNRLPVWVEEHSRHLERHQVTDSTWVIHLFMISVYFVGIGFVMIVAELYPSHREANYSH